jgi:hypothetical protein
MISQYSTYDMIGILIDDLDKYVYKEITDCANGLYRDKDGRVNRVQAFATNDPRMLAALKLLGYESICRTTVQGIETFCKL